MEFLHFPAQVGFEPVTKNWFGFGGKFGVFERKERS